MLSANVLTEAVDRWPVGCLRLEVFHDMWECVTTMLRRAVHD